MKRLYGFDYTDDHLHLLDPAVDDIYAVLDLEWESEKPGRLLFEWDCVPVSYPGNADALLEHIAYAAGEYSGAEDEVFETGDPELVALADALLTAVHERVTYYMATRLVAVHWIGSTEGLPETLALSMSGDHYERAFRKQHCIDPNREIEQGHLWGDDRIGWHDPVAGIQHAPDTTEVK